MRKNFAVTVPGFEYAGPNDYVISTSCGCGEQHTLCIGSAVSADKYGSFIEIKCMKCGREERLYFNCSSTLLSELAGGIDEIMKKRFKEAGLDEN